MSRLVPWIVSVLVAAALGYAFWPKPVPVDVGAVTVGPMTVAVVEEGKTRIKDRYRVSAPIAGRLHRIQLDPGDQVQAEQTLIASIEPSDPQLLDLRHRAEAEARIKLTKARVRQADADRQRTRLAFDHATTEFARIRSLKQTQSASQQEFDTAQMMTRMREQEHNAAQFGMQIAQFELEQAEAALLWAAPPAANDTTNPPTDQRFFIRSPIDGVVLHVLKQSEDIVPAGTPLVELGDPRKMEIEVDVLSSDAVAMKSGDAVQLEQWGGTTPLTGVIKRVEPAGFLKVSALGVEEQRVNVIIDFVDPPEQWSRLGDGYRVETRIIVWKQDKVLRAPASSLFRQGNQWAVYRIIDDTARLTLIDVGKTNPDFAEVLGGLQENDRVIAHPSDRITEGIHVTPR